MVPSRDILYILYLMLFTAECVRSMPFPLFTNEFITDRESNPSSHLRLDCTFLSTGTLLLPFSLSFCRKPFILSPVRIHTWRLFVLCVWCWTDWSLQALFDINLALPLIQIREIKDVAQVISPAVPMMVPTFTLRWGICFSPIIQNSTACNQTEIMCRGQRRKEWWSLWIQVFSPFPKQNSSDKFTSLKLRPKS